MVRQNNRSQVSIPVSGIDNATPDLTVADGKCEELHNMRWEAGSWHNIDPLQIKHQITRGVSILYHHPAAGEDVYIASRPNDDLLIDLFHVKVCNGTIIPNPDWPLYIDFAITNIERPRWRLSINSLLPVSAAVKCLLYYSNTSHLFTISAGAIESEIITGTGGFIRPDPVTAKIMPSDNSVSYQLYTDRTAAEANQLLIFASGLPADVRITHFGNILILIDPVNYSVIRYHYTSGTYHRFSIPKPPRIEELNNPPARKRLGWNHAFQDGNYNNGVDWFSKVPIYDLGTDTYLLSKRWDEGFWHGEICFFAVFKMNDGSYIAPSGLHLCASELDNCTEEARKQEDTLNYYNGTRAQATIEYRKGSGEGSWGTINQFFIRLPGGWSGETPTEGPRSPIPDITTLDFCICPTVKIHISSDYDADMIDCVTLFSTRIHPIYDTEKMKTEAQDASPVYEGYPVIGYKRSFKDLKPIFAENNLPNKPFYKVKDIKVSDFTNGVHELQLTHDLLNGIEMNEAFEPTQSLHDVYFAGMKEYNSRAHVFNLTTRLFPGYSDDMIRTSTQASTTADFYTSVKISDRSYSTHTQSSTNITKASKILSYPDFRSEAMQVFQDGQQIISAKMEPATALNVSFACRYAEEHEDVEEFIERSIGSIVAVPYRYVKYPCFKLTPTTAPIPTLAMVFSEQNRLHVSTTNNPFNMPFTNSYAIGTESNRIVAINSAAIEMSDAKFGEFPLYVFTDEGIFTLQSGSGEVLYSATIPLNFDRIINPSTLAVNHNILYITSQGIQAMFSIESKLISESLNDCHNLPPLDYLRSALMCHHPAHNELIVYNPDRSIGQAAAGTWAYVYSLDGGYWSTRDFEGKKLNTQELVLYKSPNEIEILDLDTEEHRPGQAVPVRIVSRPIKLGSAEYKRLETFIPRLRAAAPLPMRLVFEGSADLKTWITLRDTGTCSIDRDLTVRRFPCSVRYLRVTLEAATDAAFELTQFDAEYYLRFLHRLR